MSLHKRLSMSSHRSQSPLSPGPIVSSVSAADAEEWIKAWEAIYARDLIDSPVTTVRPDCSVEDACDKLLSDDVVCLAIESQEPREGRPLSGLFDFADVNAFLTLAATRHTMSPDELRENPRADSILAAAKAGHVPVELVSNLSEKNKLQTLPHDANLVAILRVFSGGCHRVLIESAEQCLPYLGMVSDRSVLSWLSTQAQNTPSLLAFFTNPLNRLALPSLHLFSAVVSTTADATTLDAMKLMNDEGVSSVAVVEEVSGSLFSAISVTDVGKIVVPQQSNEILSTPLRQLVTQIREHFGATDGEERYPVYSVVGSSTLSYTTRKLLATSAHRLFVTADASSSPEPTPTLTTPSASSHLTGVVSIIDILSLFARIANIPDVDPTRMQRHRRMSSSSSRSSRSDKDRSRSNSRAGTRVPLSSSPVARSPISRAYAGNRTSIASLNLGD